MQSKITGTVMPVLQIGIEPGETIIAETGQLSWMTAGVHLHTTMSTAGSSGIWGAVTRAFSGGGLFMTEYRSPYERGTIAFAAKVPGAIIEVDVNPGRHFMLHKHGFLCATEGVELGTGYQRAAGAGFFGGDGFVLQRLGGVCRAWVELGGEIVCHDLKPRETLLVHPGHVGMFESTVIFEVTTLPGIRNKLFGGDGLFMAQLTGPGRIWLQTLTLPGLAHELLPYMAMEVGKRSSIAGVELDVTGALVKRILG